MKITLESTAEIVELNGVPARVWQGQTEHGVEVYAFVTRLAVPSTHVDQFEVEAEEQLVKTEAPRAASDSSAVHPRLVL